MAAQLVSVARLPVYRSGRRVSIFPSLPDDRIENVGPVTRYEYCPVADKVIVHLQDRSIQDVDYVVFGTGYYPDVPFLRVLEYNHECTPETGRNATAVLIPLTGREIQPARIPSLFRQVIYAGNPTLAFIGALISFIPFIFHDLTSTWLTLVWSGRIEIPDTIQDRLQDEQERLKTIHQLRSQTDNPSNLTSFHFLREFELSYAKLVRSEIIQASPDLEDILAKWDDEQDGRRFAMYGAKLDSLYVLAGKDKPLGGTG